MSDTLSKFSGVVTILSFDSRIGGCQATLVNPTAQLGTSEPVIVNTTEPRMQTLLETSMLKNVPVVVEYQTSEQNDLVSVYIQLAQ